MTGKIITGAYLLTCDGKLFIEDERGGTAVLPLNELSEDDQQYAEKRLNQIRKLNNQFASEKNAGSPFFTSEMIFAFVVLSLILAVKKSVPRVYRAALLLRTALSDRALVADAG